MTDANKNNSNKSKGNTTDAASGITMLNRRSSASAVEMSSCGSSSSADKTAAANNITALFAKSSAANGRTNCYSSGVVAGDSAGSFATLPLAAGSSLSSAGSISSTAGAAGSLSSAAGTAGGLSLAAGTAGSLSLASGSKQLRLGGLPFTGDVEEGIGKMSLAKTEEKKGAWGAGEGEMGGKMAADNKQSLVEIRTRSVEQTLLPLVTQITTLVNARGKMVKSEHTVNALRCVGMAVSNAVERFVAVGKSIARENPDIERDVEDACEEARLAGVRIQQVTNVKLDDSPISPSGSAGRIKSPTSPPNTNSLEKGAMVRAARQLLSAITKVLLLADKIVVKQLITAKNKVLESLGRIESCKSFTEFVTIFTQFGSEMVSLAHLSGDRQQDLKSDKCRTQIMAARSVLEKSTVVLLTTAKTSLRHPECAPARENTVAVIAHMRRALDNMHNVVCNGGYSSGGMMGGSGDLSPSAMNSDSGINLSQHQPTAVKAFKDFTNQVEMTRVTLIGAQTEYKLLSLVESLIDTTQDFTDSAYTSHDRRQRILMCCERLRHDLTVLIRVGVNMRDGKISSSMSHQLETEILKTQEAATQLHNQLIETSMEQASDLFRLNDDQRLLSDLRTAGLEANRGRVDELSVKFEEHSDQLQEVCKLLRHIANTDALLVWCEHIESNIRFCAPEVIHSIQALASCNASSGESGNKIVIENAEAFSTAWQIQINDLSVLVKDINDSISGGKAARQMYLSLPKPGKHGSSAKPVRASQLSSEEQARIAKAGLEMKLITSEMDAETDRWSRGAGIRKGEELEEEEAGYDNEILRRAKNMSSMAFSMYLFTRGEGVLRTTQDLFTQASYFAEEGTKLYKALKLLTSQPGLRSDLSSQIEVLPYHCQQLFTTVKSETVGKTATFNKVDKVIQDTKNLMNAVSKVISASLLYPTLHPKP